MAGNRNIATGEENEQENEESVKIKTASNMGKVEHKWNGHFDVPIKWALNI